MLHESFYCLQPAFSKCLGGEILRPLKGADAVKLAVLRIKVELDNFFGNIQRIFRFSIKRPFLANFAKHRNIGQDRRRGAHAGLNKRVAKAFVAGDQ